MSSIILGRADDIVDGLEEESIDLVVTSPPYYNAKKEYAEYDSVYEFFQEMAIVFGVMRSKLNRGARVCINTASGYGRSPYIHLGAKWIDIMERLNYSLRGEIVWNKGASVGSSTAWGCHDTETEIRTRDGWITFDLLTTSDEVLTLIPETKSWEFVPVKDVVNYYYEGEMYRYSDDKVDFVLTPNHNMIHVDGTEFTLLGMDQVEYLLGLPLRIPTTNSPMSKINIIPLEVPSIERFEYGGMVGCATVDCGVLYTRRNGKYLLSGNSWMSPSSPHIRDQHEMIYVFGYSGNRLDGNTEDATITRDDFLELTKSVWDIPTVRSKLHPAIMPEELARRLIELYSYMGNTVLDPFCGIGTVPVVAKRLGREGIGVDYNKEYVDVATNKLQMES